MVKPLECIVYLCALHFLTCHPLTHFKQSFITIILLKLLLSRSPTISILEKKKKINQDRSYSLCMIQPQQSHPITSAIFYSLKQVSESNPYSKGGDYLSVNVRWGSMMASSEAAYHSTFSTQTSRFKNLSGLRLCEDPHAGFCLPCPLTMMVPLLSNKHS